MSEFGVLKGIYFGGPNNLPQEVEVWMSRVCSFFGSDLLGAILPGFDVSTS